MAQLIWSPRALMDIELIHNYIEQDSDENARKFVQELIGVIVNIPDFPFSGRVVPEYKDQKTREKLYKNYRVIYRLRVEAIEIITILHQTKRLN